MATDAGKWTIDHVGRSAATLIDVEVLTAGEGRTDPTGRRRIFPTVIEARFDPEET